MTNEELVEKIQTGENVKENMGLLYEQNRRFIYKCALSYSKEAEIADLMQEAYFGLQRAVELYKPKKEVKFLTFAAFHIKVTMQRYAYNYGRLRRLPAKTLQLIFKYNKIIAEYAQNHNDEPTDEYLCGKLGINQKRLDILKRVIRESQTVSLDDAIPGTDDLKVGDEIADEDAENDMQRIFKEATEKSIKEKLNAVISSALTDTENKVLKLSFGIGCKAQTQEKIALRLKVSGSRVQQIKHDALKKLRHSQLKELLGDDYLFKAEPLTKREYKSSGNTTVEDALTMLSQL